MMTVVRGQLPDFAALGIEWPAPLDAVAEYESLRDRYGATAAAVDRLLREREAVRLQDREALGAALRAGKRDPGASLVAEHEAKIVAAERQHEALGIAVNAAYADLVARVEQYRAEWSAEVGEQLAHDRQDLAVAVHRWAETRRRLHEHRALASWVASFPATKGFKVPAPPITGLVARNLEPMPAADVLRRSPPRWRRERAGSARTGTAAILTGVTRVSSGPRGSVQPTSNIRTRRAKRSERSEAWSGWTPASVDVRPAPNGGPGWSSACCRRI